MAVTSNKDIGAYQTSRVIGAWQGEEAAVGSTDVFFKNQTDEASFQQVSSTAVTLNGVLVT